MNKYTYDEVFFMVSELKDEEFIDMRIRNKAISRFQDKFGVKHSYDSLKMLVDNIGKNFEWPTCRNFDSGSKMVRSICTQFIASRNTK